MSSLSERCRHTYTHLLLQFIVLVKLIQVGSSFQFSYSDFSTNSSDFTFDGNATVLGSVARLLPDPNPSLATDPSNESAIIYWSGWMAYKDAIPFLGTSASSAHSFNTSFKFKFITEGNGQYSPSGMAFFITTTPQQPRHGVLNGYFGIGNDTYPTNYFVVEFDTWITSGTSDPSYSHVGIDINSINSSAVVDTSNTSTDGYYPELYLLNNYTFTVWISYDASLQTTKVWMTNNTNDYSSYLNPPEDSVLEPIMQYQDDLSSTFVDNDMYVGFSAGTESDDSMLGVAIYSWYFSINENATAYVGAPAPSATPSPPTPPATESQPVTEASPPSPVKDAAHNLHQVSILLAILGQLAIVAIFL